MLYCIAEPDLESDLHCTGTPGSRRPMPQPPMPPPQGGPAMLGGALDMSQPPRAVPAGPMLFVPAGAQPPQVNAHFTLDTSVQMPVIVNLNIPHNLYIGFSRQMAGKPSPLPP